VQKYDNGSEDEPDIPASVTEIFSSESALAAFIPQYDKGKKRFELMKVITS